jgi:hypothetical protein
MVVNDIQTETQEGTSFILLLLPQQKRRRRGKTIFGPFIMINAMKQVDMVRVPCQNQLPESLTPLLLPSSFHFLVFEVFRKEFHIVCWFICKDFMEFVGMRWELKTPLTMLGRKYLPQTCVSCSEGGRDIILICAQDL